MNLIRRFKWPIIAGGAAVLLVAFLLFRPDKLFIDDAVDESLADAFPVTASEDAADPTPSTTEATTTTTTEAPPATTEPSSTESNSNLTEGEATTTTTTTEPAGPVALGTGAFYGIDHSAEGTATVYELDGDFVLRFEDDTDIQNGPDLYVWVLAADSYDGGRPGEYIDLGKIKGNIGGQNYELPTEFDPNVHQFVLIWCERFSVPFAASPLV